MIRIISDTLSVRRLALVLIEHLLIVLSMMVAALVRLGVPDSPADAAWNLLWRGSVVGGVLQFALHYCDLYDLHRIKDRRELFRGLLQAIGAASFILAVLYYWIPDLIIGRGVFAIASILIIALVAGWRVAFEWLSLRGTPKERLLIVGTNAAAVNLARELFERRTELGVELVGFVDPDPANLGMPVINPGVIGTIGDIPQIVRSRGVDRVVVSLTEARGRLPMNDLLEMKLNQGVRFDHLASVYEQYTGKIAVENLRPSWLIFSEGFRKSSILEGIKRISDVVFALIGLIVAAPIMAIVALLVRFTSPGPALYSQTRVGKDGVNFTIYKFRSMRADAEAATGAVWATTGDARVTPFGRLMRRSRLDELPQLWNVLIGNMSFVGPRPERPEFIQELCKQIPYYGQRHAVRPGLTGWAQVRHRYGSTMEDSLQKLQYDLFYIKNMSFAFDIFIVLETVKTVMVRAGS
jgi:sugar transferase (PEP-CTERM system associated)